MGKKKVIGWCLAVALVCCLGFWGIKAAGNTDGQMVPEPWDIITFGSYEQDNNLSNGAEPIKWIVLSVEGDEALLLSKRCLDCKPFNEDETAVTWENCSLRKWLNNEFYKKAFSDSEKSKIVETLTINSDSIWGIDGGNNTLDKVFLLSLEEATASEYGFSTSASKTDTSRYAPASAYAKGQGVWYSNRGYDEEDEDADEYGGIDSCYWWLRSMGETATNAVSVCDYGDIETEGYAVNEEGNGVRPAIYIKLGNSANNAQGSGVIGDINEDGEISAKDVTQLRRYLAGGWDVKINTTEADLNEDNEVNAKDVTILRRYLAGGWGVVLPKKTSDSGNVVPISKSNFPDRKFRKYVSEKFDSNDDGFLSEKEIENAKEIDVSNYGLDDLAGLEYLSSLESLYCYNNKLKTLNLSSNNALKGLDCSDNQLESLNVTNNTSLTLINCCYNKIKSLDLQNNIELVELDCHYNALTSLDVSKNIALKELDCEENQLTSLDFSNNTVLKELYCSENQLTSLDVGNNTALKELYCSHNQLTSLDVSNNTALQSLSCNHNQLTSLDISKNKALVYLYCYFNQLTNLDSSNNNNLKTLSCDNNQLTYIDLTYNSRLLKENGVCCDEGVSLRFNFNKIELTDIVMKDPARDFDNNVFESDFELRWNVNEYGIPVLSFKKVNGDGNLEMDGEIAVNSSIKIQKANYYDQKGRIIRKIDDDKTYEYEYDEKDRVIKEINNGSVYEREYDEDDRVIKSKTLCQDGSKEECEYTYHVDGGFKTSFVKEYNSNGVVIEESFKEYDAKGMLINAYRKYSSGEFNEYKTEYNEDGKPIRILDDRYNWGDSVIIFDFDEKGDMIRRTTKENEGTENERVTIRETTYDEQGRVITGFKILDDYHFGLEWFYAEYNYDSKGRIAHESFSENDILEFTRDYTYEYDELDRVISEDVYRHNWDTGDSYKKQYIYEGNTDVVKEEIYSTRYYDWRKSSFYTSERKTEYSDGVVIRKTTTHVDDEGNDLGYLYVEDYTNGIISKSSKRENLDGDTIVIIYDSEGNPVNDPESGRSSNCYDDAGRLIKTARYSISYFDEGTVSFVEIEDNDQESVQKYSFDAKKGLLKQHYLRKDIETESETIIDSEWNTIMTHNIRINDDGFSVEYWYDKDKRVMKAKDKQWGGKTYEAIYEYFKNGSGIDCRKALTQYSDGSSEYSLQQYGYDDWDSDDIGYCAYERNIYAVDGSYVKKLYRYDDRGVSDEAYYDIKIDKDGNMFTNIGDIWEEKYVPTDSRIIVY